MSNQKTSKKIKQFLFFAYAATGIGISGSDRIFIELARRWVKKTGIDIYVTDEGKEMCMRQKLVSGIKYQVLDTKEWRKLGFFIDYIARIILGIERGFSINLENVPSTIVYSASEFWMDSLPCLILKLRFRKITWLASWFQTAPNPLKGFSTGNRETTYKFRAFLYWFAQLPIKPLIAYYADLVIVNNETERNQFPALNKRGKTIVLIGAVPLNEIEKFKKNNKHFRKVYDAVFQGRFHPQKGVVELVDIWKSVVAKIPTAKLAMIGDGPLMEDVKAKIKESGLEKNINLMGFVFDGELKYKTFAESKVVVHPAFYDSGGMASAEAMAFGIPCVGFDLKAYKSYYPKGMVKAKREDKKDFVNKLLELLKNARLRQRIGKEAELMIYRNYSWDVRAEEIFGHIASKY